MDRIEEKEIKELILEVLYENRTLNINLAALVKKVNELYYKDFELSDFSKALKKLRNEDFIGSREAAFPLTRNVSYEGYTGEQEVIEVFYITERGIYKVLLNQLKQKNIRLSKQDKMMTEIASKMDKQSRDVDISKQEITLLKEDIVNKTDEVTTIRDEVDKIKKEFNRRILLIFGIFLSVFAFIIVGLTLITTLVNQGINWITNFSNISAILFPLLIVLLILMLVTFLIIRATS